MSNIFVQLALILGISSIFGFMALRTKLPIIIAYLLAGVLIAILPGLNGSNLAVFKFLPDLGIALVLFLIGMELNLWEIKSLGKPIIFTSLCQILITSLAGFTIAYLFNFNTMESFYLGVGLAFSSTVVVIKMLLEKKELNSLFGKLSVGILLIEDLVAIGILMAISVSSSSFHLGLQNSLPLVMLIIKAGGLFLATFLLSRYVLKSVFRAVAGSVELLFLTALTWCFVFTTVAVVLGFSVVIGAFLAGIALASSPYQVQIQGKIKPLRDFFLALFFVYLGAHVHLPDLVKGWPLMVIFTSYILLVKPLIILLCLGVFGFKKHTIFQVAIHLTQLSEFSLVILLVGINAQVAPPYVLSIVSAATVCSVIISTVLISYSREIYKRLSPLLSFFEHKTKTHILEDKLTSELIDHVMIFGSHRVGSPIIRFLKREKIPFMVMDFNPKVIEGLRAEDIVAIYGDVGDPDVLEGLQLENARLIICTAEDLADNELLLLECKRRRVRAPIVVTAGQLEDEEILQKLGADYVLIPDKVSADFLVEKLKTHWPQIKF
ncbi:hypothetical protein A2631_03785 [Candidatus Daviesbacteria bacterium RIFCSPHIGHO2_01_FULL_44_29]|uniref:RCK N-terminal domain-containing protein n=1 Tax=Candidatus Daviesbacteria bacterium RIFCSPHIGHO2_02_FULL_43_12 TaxID=1797776 RepID=A0A1F5KHZ5_9BACT|nr:MAG: hypothetical protein A2631_03785 [Candidatus Daviesbacteria bacterium RIFCSPHIGHO2_01_FULL_44_29]OGE39807.1 MAG: hypothetical protein A3E86_04525 [Candidatus Daviesbacteria bacterium RIFCSPHIGHO2_12_FULL_47_45]OGE40479.1 MAG: hypothetical protein A3D25_00245 [Candidatus Daviesbacteria bacterium RIFCSPHIGHO2_02_FULL_43_12]OGE70030.1 MAG: hypothetical protein A3B55_05045 [Candidatus Daviesbacteria bacterium RIFCSPLOWO2_01_FULL_43_15]